MKLIISQIIVIITPFLFLNYVNFQEQRGDDRRRRDGDRDRSSHKPQKESEESSNRKFLADEDGEQNVIEDRPLPVLFLCFFYL